MQKDRSPEVLRRLIAAASKSPTEVARESGVGQSTLSRILRGKIEHPTDRQIAKLASYFGVSSDQVRGRQPITDDEILRIATKGAEMAFQEPRAPYADGDELELHDTEIIEDGEKLPPRPDEVDLPCFREVEFAAGDGRTQVVENHGHSVRFPLSKLSARSVSPENAACATASGSSMEPTIMDGSPIAIDKGTRHIIDGKIYALDHGGMLRIKRLYRMPLGQVRLVSDNHEEYPEEVHALMGPDAPRVIGRVFWWENFD